jgi:hypothetical protein
MRVPIILTVTLTGCAAPIANMANMAYNGVSAVSVVSTGKGLPELGASAVTNSDCSIYNYLVKNKDYLCEQRDPGTTYNRNGL